jgi:hypothetical protein
MMKQIMIALNFLLVPLLLQSQSQVTKGEVTEWVECLRDTSQHYAVFLPADYDESIQWPVIIFYEPLARAALPLKQYRELANRFGYIMLCSYNSQNGPDQPVFDATNAMYADAMDWLNLDPKRLNLCGFSGGARIAFLIGLLTPDVSAVIGCGAGMPYMQDKDPSIGFDYLGFAGIRDMNYQELITLDSTLDGYRASHMIVTFPGGHRWPDARTFRLAFYWLETNEMRSGKRPPDPETYREIDAVHQEYLDSLASGGKVTEQVRVLDNLIHILNGLVDVTNEKNQRNQLIASPEYAKIIEREVRTRNIETELRKKYATEFEEISLRVLDPNHPVKPPDWWEYEYQQLDTILDPDLRARLWEYMIFVSWEQHYTYYRDKQYIVALTFLDVYQAGLPGDPNPDYYKAVVHAAAGNRSEMYDYLQRAIDKGLDDPARVVDEAAFERYRNQKKYKILVDKLTNP